MTSMKLATAPRFIHSQTAYGDAGMLPSRPMNWFSLSTFFVCALASIGALAAGIASAEEFTRPVYRVANEDTSAGTSTAGVSSAGISPTGGALPAAPGSTVPPTANPQAFGGPQVDPAVQPAAAQQGLQGSPFNLQQQPGEHPLMPCLRLAKQGLVEMDTNIRGYTATVTKTERINGKLGEPQQMTIKVRHEPFSVYMKFIQPHAGREVLYNSAQNPAKLVALDSGWKRRFGPVTLATDGRLAMAGQRYPITMMGIRNLTAELVKIAEQDVKYGECSVRYSTAAKIDGRPTTMIEAVHPNPRKNFRFHIARIFVDNEMRIPVAYAAYSWPTQAGGKPPLEEQYVYTNVRMNPGLTATDFDEKNPNIFK